MDTKNTIILGICIIIAALVIALMLRTQAPTPTQVGRFQISGVPNEWYVIDTETGQVWEDYGPGSDFEKPKVK